MFKEKENFHFKFNQTFKKLSFVKIFTNIFFPIVFVLRNVLKDDGITESNVVNYIAALSCQSKDRLNGMGVNHWRGPGRKGSWRGRRGRGSGRGRRCKKT